MLSENLLQFASLVTFCGVTLATSANSIGAKRRKHTKLNKNFETNKIVYVTFTASFSMYISHEDPSRLYDKLY